MDLSWIETTLTASLMVVLSTIGIYVTLLFFVRISGVRSFSKLSSFDFAITIAIGSVLATTVVTKNPPLLQAIVALASLFALQMLIASLRDKGVVRLLVDNKPVLLMKGNKMLIDNMDKAKVSRSDLLGKLREANVVKVEQIYAVVMETTGDIAVLHGDKEEMDFDTVLMGSLKEEFESSETGDPNSMKHIDINSIEQMRSGSHRSGAPMTVVDTNVIASLWVPNDMDELAYKVLEKDSDWIAKFIK